MKKPVNKGWLIYTVICVLIYMLGMIASACSVNGWLPGLVNMFGLGGYNWARLAIVAYLFSMFGSYNLFPAIEAKEPRARIFWYMPAIMAIVLTFMHLFLIRTETESPGYAVFTIFVIIAVVALCTWMMSKSDTDDE